MSKEKVDAKQIKQKFIDGLPRLQKYNFILFAVFISLIYAVVLFKIESLKNAEPSADSVSAQVKAAKIPKIDESVVQQLQSLHDNSVSVQTLFESTRSNPFKE